MSNSRNILLGYSGHAYVVIEAAVDAGIPVNYYADTKEIKKNPFGLEYMGYEGNPNFKGWNEDFGFLLGVGDNNIRVKLANLVKQRGKSLLKVVHPSSSISKSAQVGSGTFVAAGTVINALVQVGKFVILNTGCIIEHECFIKKGVHIAPGAVLAGNVKVGERSFIGANAVVKEGVTIGKDVIVGAGATIIRDVPDCKKIAGNPGREL